MRKLLFFSFAAILIFTAVNWAISDSSDTERERRAKVNTRIDNNGYWKKMAKEGLAVLNPVVEVPEAVYTGSRINSRAVRYDNSPDVPVTTEPSTQSENSIFIDPNDNMVAFNSNNSTPANGGSVYGANYLYTFDFASTWAGDIHGPNGSNSGDPATCIGTDGRWYVGYIGTGSGQDISYSDDKGETWTKVQVAPKPGTGWGDLADKNHMWIDAKEGSPYENHLYNAWTDFGGPNNNQVVLKRSTDKGESWDPKVNLSQAISTSGHNQGVNISTGPNGEVYAVWTIYDNWPNDENSMGMARSFDGGATWESAYRIIDNIKGIRNSGVPQNMRVNSFPVMAVDASNGPNSGNIYVVWTNSGVPGVNTGSDKDIYLIKSTDEGLTWSDPIRVNQDPIGQGKTHYLPWITCDASSGVLSVIFYDNRNTSPSQAEAWVAVSTNGGESWEDFKVSDVAFTPSPIPGLASGYFGDYLAIHSSEGKVYPCWTDNRTGTAMTYVSVFETLDIIAPSGLTANTDQETGECNLQWDFNGTTGFDYFNIYRNDVLVTTTTELTYSDQLTDYGYYDYEITAIYSGSIESTGTTDQTQFGSSSIEISPTEFTTVVYPEETETQIMKIKNTGVLDLDFSLSPFFKKSNNSNYQIAKGGGGEYIYEVRLSNLLVTSGSNYYSDYSNVIANIDASQSYPIEVISQNPYEGDQCVVWIDLDQNGKYDEEPYVLNDDDNFGTFRGVINLKKGTKQGITGMRIRLAGTETLSAYGDTEYGEVEDYLVAIASWLSLDPDNGIIPPGDSMMIDVTFDASGMTQGTYMDDVILITNDIENPGYTIDFTMHITDILLTASANPMELCVGGSTQLEAIVSGGSGTYTYSWTSIPEGFSSSEPNPIAEPMENTEYHVSVFDGSITIESSVSIIVYDVPIVNLGGNQILCGETQTELNAGNPDATYLWSTGDTTQTITATGTGPTIFWAKVTNVSGCSTIDTVTINFASIPVVDLGSDTTICGGQDIILDAGNPGSEFLWSNLETSQTILADTLGHGFGIREYGVMVTNEFGCTGEGEVNVEFLDCTGVIEISSINLKTFPNPTNGVFTIEFDNEANNPVDIVVLNSSGKIVFSKENVNEAGSNNRKIDISNFAAGIYTISVSIKGKDYTSRIVLRK